MWRPNTPQSLLDSALAGQLAIILGPGAELGASHEDASLAMPSENGLRDMISFEYFNGDRRFESLETLAREVVSARGTGALEAWLRRVNLQYSPNTATRALPKYDWRGLCAFGYDSMVEIAYVIAGRRLHSQVTNGQRKQNQFLLRPLEWRDNRGLPQTLVTGGHLCFRPDDEGDQATLLKLLAAGPVALFGVSPSDRVLFDLIREQSRGPVYVSGAPSDLLPRSAEVHSALFGDMMRDLGGRELENGCYPPN